MSRIVPIGFTKKAHGIRGQVRVQVEDRYRNSFLRADVVFIEVGGSPVPFFVERIQENGGLLLKLEEYDQREAVIPMTGKELSLREADIVVPDEHEVVELTALVGYEIVDETIGTVGEIRDILEMPEQLLAAVEYGEKEVLIPLVSGLIVEMTHRPARIRMDLPEGLLEL